MPLPQKFSDSKHIKDVIRSVINKMVRSEFMEPDEVNWEPNINTPKASLRKACTHEPKDSLILTVARLLVFYLIKGKLKELFPSTTSKETHNLSKGLAQYPQITLYFSQDPEAVPQGIDPLTLETSFRLVGETTSLFTRGNATTLGQSIKREMVVAGKGITHDKGKLMATYYDYTKGYKLNILCQQKQDAVDLIRKILAIRSHTYEPNCFQLNTPEKDSVNNPTGTITVLGEQVGKPRWRPTARVRFTHAMVSFPDLPKSYPIVDTTGRFPDALVR